MTTYTEQELIAAVQAGYHAPDDLPLATRSWLEGYRAGRSNPQPVVPALPTMQKAFVTAESGYGKYCLVFKFRTLGDLQAAHNEWVTQPAPQPVVPEGSVILSLKDAKMLLINVVDQLRITKGVCDANRLASSNNALISAILDAEKQLSAGKEAV
jgi:hypothetical protein